MIEKLFVTTHVALSEALPHKKYKEIQSATESYNQITKKNIGSSVGGSINHAIDFEMSEKYSHC